MKVRSRPRISDIKVGSYDLGRLGNIEAMARRFEDHSVAGVAANCFDDRSLVILVIRMVSRLQCLTVKQAGPKIEI